MSSTTDSDTLDREPALGLLMVAVPMWITDLRSWPEEQRLAAAREAGQYIAEHGDDLMFKSKPGRSKDAFNQLARGLAAAAYQPGGITFAGMHFCTDHAVCKAASDG